MAKTQPTGLDITAPRGNRSWDNEIVYEPDKDLQLMPTAGKLELIIKISELPEVKTVENGLQYFELDCNGRIFAVTVKPKVWKKLTDAQANWTLWVAAIAGQLGTMTPDGFVLEQPNIQVFEKKPRGEEAPAG